MMNVEFRVERIPVPQSAFHSENPDDLAYYVDMLVERFFVRGGFAREELPPEIFMIHNVVDYEAQVNNGGHAQFAANSACDATTLSDIRAGLAAMNEPVAAGIFADFEARRDVDPEAFDAAINDAGAEDPSLDDLDDRFYAQPLRALRATSAAWLRSLPHLTPVPDEEYEAGIAALLASNPNAPARVARLYVHPDRWESRDSFVQALRFVTEQADGDAVFNHMVSGGPVDVPGTGKAGRWMVMTNRLRAHIWMFPDRAVFEWQDGTEPAVVVPIDAVRAAVRARTGEDIPIEAFGLPPDDDAPPPAADGWFRSALRRLRSGFPRA